MSVLNDSIQADSQCHNTILSVSLNARTTYRQTSARSRLCGRTIKIPCPFSPSYARNSPRNLENSLLNSDIGDFMNYFNSGKKKSHKKGKLT